MTYRKKLIEVALPLDAINIASAREKSIRHGHPSMLHLWWARRPLAAARAVIFSQMVDDPSEHVTTLLGDPAKKRVATRELGKRREAWNDRKAKFDEALSQKHVTVPAPGPEPTLEECIADIERERLFGIIRKLVLWENTTNEAVLQEARDEIWQSWRATCAENADQPRAKELFDRQKLPAFHDPFAGGGALPLEAQRLGLEAYASDLNPVAVLINKAMIEIPPRFAGQPPVNPEARAEKRLMDKQWRGAEGLAEDVRYYGKWMREEAEKRIGYLYPKVEITAEMAQERPDLKKYVGQELTVIAWLWARTVKSPNPAFAQVDVPLASTFMLSTKAGKEVYVEPMVDADGYRFTVKVGTSKDPAAAQAGTSAGRRAAFKCVMSGTPVSYEYIRAEGKAGRMAARLMAIVAEGERGRVYLSPTESMEAAAREASPDWEPDTRLEGKCRVNVSNYGLDSFSDLFTRRQLVALTTFTDLVQEACACVKRDAIAGNLFNDSQKLADAGVGATAYADAVSVYLGLAIDKAIDYNSSLVLWSPTRDQAKTTFTRQALPMAFDFAETNLFAGAAGDIGVSLDGIARALVSFGFDGNGHAVACDSQTQSLSLNKVVSTDPPYYDNIAYADLSDFFYVWLRKALKPIFPDLFATLSAPKAEELVATPYRHGNKEKAEAFFLHGMTQSMNRLVEQAHPAFPVTIYYAFKQSETESDGEGGTVSTGWDTFLEAVIRAGFGITGTWPVRTERGSRSIGFGANALASSIVLVCRRRATDALSASRQEFVSALKTELPVALTHLQRGNIAPVDLAQAAIGPGMAIYTRYAKVLDAQGKPLSVRQALSLINQTLDEALAEQEGDFDADSRWALTWFEQSGFDEGEYGIAEQLSTSKNTSVAGMVEAGILASSRGKVRLLRPEELPLDWDPTFDSRLTVWEMVHHLIRRLAISESSAAELAAQLGAKAETARELCYRLYTLCDRKKRTVEAQAYNGLVQSWPEIMRLAREDAKPVIASPRMQLDE